MRIDGAGCVWSLGFGAGEESSILLWVQDFAGEFIMGKRDSGLWVESGVGLFTFGCT